MRLELPRLHADQHVVRHDLEAEAIAALAELGEQDRPLDAVVLPVELTGSVRVGVDGELAAKADTGEAALPERHAEHDGHPASGSLFDFGLFFQKGLRMGTGQANVNAYNRELMRLIHVGKANPAFLVSHELSLEAAPDAYKHFDNREDGWTKVVLKPGMSN